MAIAVIIIVIGLMGSAFISASEAALISVNKVRMRRLAEEGLEDYDQGLLSEDTQ